MVSLLRKVEEDLEIRGGRVGEGMGGETQNELEKRANRMYSETVLLHSYSKCGSLHRGC